jgi:GST-like protein
MWQTGGFGPMPHQLSHFQTVANTADRRYGIERYSKETRRLYGVFDKPLSEVEFAGGGIPPWLRLECPVSRPSNATS